MRKTNLFTAVISAAAFTLASVGAHASVFTPNQFQRAVQLAPVDGDLSVGNATADPFWYLAFQSLGATGLPDRVEFVETAPKLDLLVSPLILGDRPVSRADLLINPELVGVVPSRDLANMLLEAGSKGSLPNYDQYVTVTVEAMSKSGIVSGMADRAITRSATSAPDTTPTPLPGGAVFMATGLAAFAAWRGRKRRKA